MLFEILPVIVYQIAGVGLTDLPVEMLATILRYLDPNSLVNAVKAYKACKDVCLGDQILRRRLKTFLAEKRRLDMERVTNPALGITVARNKPTEMFGKNVMKHVGVRVFPRGEDYECVAKDFLDRKRKRNKKVVKARVGERRNYHRL